MKVSVIVPFREEPGTTRKASWQWLKKRWKALYPDFQLVVGKDEGMPYSKTTAVNEGYTRAKGEILVICDADSWVEPHFLFQGIDYASQHPVMVVPWTSSWRLRAEESKAIMALPPDTQNPLTNEVKNACTDFRPSPATAAMCIILQRKAFEDVGGMDPRFRGWGSEDVAFALACGTLLGQTKILSGEAWALWHSRPRTNNGKGFRIWAGDSGGRNHLLGRKYRQAYRNPKAMWRLCSEHALSGHPLPEPQGVFPELPPPPSGHLVREFAYGGTRVGERIVL